MASEVSINPSSYWTPKSISASAVGGSISAVALALGILRLFGVAWPFDVGMVGGISLTVGGGVSLVALVVVSVLLYRRSKEAAEEEKLSSIPVTSRSTSNPTTPRSIYDTWNAVTSLAESTDQIRVLSRDSPHIDPSADTLTRKRVMGIYAANEERVLAKKLAEIDGFQPADLAAFSLRVAKLKEEASDSKPGTLGELRQRVLQASDLAALPPKVVGLLTSVQLALLIAHSGTDRVMVSRLLPASTMKFNQTRMRKIAQRIIPYLSKLDGSLTDLLPLKIFKDENIPWENVSLNEAKGLKVFNNFTVEKVNQIAPRLKATFFSFILPKVLRDERFNWHHWMNKAGIGIELAKLEEETFFENVEKFLAMLVEKIEEVKSFLNKCHPYGIKKAQCFTEKLTLDQIEPLISVITVNMVKWIDSDILKSPHFPWSEFLKRPGIGKALREWGDISFEVIPWDELSVIEAEELFVTEDDDKAQHTTQQLLGQLTEPARERVTILLGAVAF